MKSKLIPILVANLFAGSAAMAQDAGFKVSGSVDVGARTTRQSSKDALGNKVDSAKANEYRDLDSSALGSFDIKGRGPNSYFDAYGENLGRDDQYLDLKGGRYGMLRYQLYQNDIVHNFTFGARTPHSGAGSSTLTGTFPASTNANTWNTYDLGYKRKDRGGMFEFSQMSPWFVRLDANEVSTKGTKVIAGASGTSPGNGFVDKPEPVDHKTRNYTLEGGYATKRAQVTVSFLKSRFANVNDQLQWTNPFFGNQLDTTTLAVDNDYTKYSVNGMLKQLPLDSTVSARITRSKATSSVPIAATALNTGGVYNATNPSISTFDGNVEHNTSSLSWHANPVRALDTRVYWNKFDKENQSTHVTFTGLATGLTCGRIVVNTTTVVNPGDCATETLSYKKTNTGIDAGYRFNPQNRVVVGYDVVDLKRDRIDFDETKDRRLSAEYKNNSLDALTARVKVQSLRRRSNFLEGAAGASANDPNYLNRYIARFDAANVDQTLFKVGADATPMEALDFGLEYIVKKNNYRDTVLGRTKDDRSEIYASVGYGDLNKLRVFAFGDLELVQYDSYHRNISTVSSGTTGVNSPQSGNCQTTAPNCYDPNTAPNSSNYNWAATNKDRNWAIGVGADWKVVERVKLSSSIILQQTKGVVDFAVQSGANPSTPATQISNFDNTRKTSFNLKGNYRLTKAWDVTGGYAYEKYTFSDIAYDGYTYTVGTGTSTAYLSGAYANPNYTVHVLYVIGTFRFE